MSTTKTTHEKFIENFAILLDVNYANKNFSAFVGSKADKLYYAFCKGV